MTNSIEEISPKKKKPFMIFVSPHPAIEEPRKRREARLAAVMIIVSFFWSLVGLFSIFAVRGFDTSVLLAVLPLLIITIIAYIISRTPYYMSGIIFLVVSGSINTIYILASGVENIPSTLFSSIPPLFIIGSAFFSVRGAVIFIFTDIIALGLLPIFSTQLSPRDLFRDLLTLLFLGIVLIITISSRLRVDKEHLEEADETNKKLKHLSDSLEEHIENLNENTTKLEKQSSYLKGAANVSRASASLTDTDQLSQEVVELIRETFNLYYVGLFLVDNEEKFALLQAGTGKAGEIMLADKHRLRIGEGMIGWAIKQKQARIALDVGTDAVQFQNPNLPETRSEAAIPLRSRGRVLGALTVQSSEEAAFSPEIVSTLQTMADQIAIAFDNTNLLSQSEAALEAERRAYGEMSYSAWSTLAQSGNIPAYGIKANGKAYTITSEENEALHENVVIEEDGFTAQLPIKSHGKVLGGIRIAKDPARGAWRKEEVELAETLAEELSISLENARLFEDSQRRATREHIISGASAKMRETLDIESVLATAAQEFRDSLSMAEAEVWINVDQPSRIEKGDKS